MQQPSQLRLFFGGIMTETNTFSPIPVAMQSFSSCLIQRGEALLDLATGSKMALYAKERGIEVIGGLYADAHPGAAVDRATYEALRDELLDRLRDCGPVDIVALNLHGGMIAHGYDDCEGDLIQKVREVVGSKTVIGAELDPHSHLSPLMHENALLMCYRENPHVDIDARGRELVDLLIRAARHEVTPVTSIFDCRMADVFQTNREPMRGFVARMKALEGVNDVLSISIVHGFRRADIPLMGTKVIVITNNRADYGAELAMRLGMELFALRGQCAQPTTPLKEAVVEAIVWDERFKGPLILADMADNPGGGSPGDSTFILEALLDAQVDNIAVGVMIDPLAVRYAAEAGVGANLRMRIGGKACPFSGTPLDLDVTVTRVEQAAKIQLEPNTVIEMGCAVALRFAKGEILLAEARNQTYGPSIFSDMGIDLRTKKIIVVKSAQHFKAHFDPISPHSLIVDSPGVCISDVTRLPFSRISRPMWPWDEDPFSLAAS